jgi:hypothetical protein
MTEEAKTNIARPDRSKSVRTPLGQRNRLTFKDLEPGYSYRVINDKDDRLKNALEGGYEFVESKNKLGDAKAAEGSTPGSRVAKPVGNGTNGYLMRIKDEYYKEDQAAKELKLKETEKAMTPDKTRNQYGEGLQTEKE